MARVTQLKDRRSSVDQIVDYLYGEITSMRLLPGTRISETEIATHFGVSRQPVRDAFNRLENMDLIRIRPKKATEVKKFSMAAIEKSRFVRAAIEAAALRCAAQECDEAGGYQLDACIALQKKAQAEVDHQAFAQLDYDFHKMLCEIGKVAFAFDLIKAEKEKLDRLCLLGLAKEDRMARLIKDHEDIVRAVKAGQVHEAVEIGMLHLTRLDDTIQAIRVNSSAYFETDSE